MAEFYDISEWEEKQHYNTGGTRNKLVVENPHNLSLYFFKTSLKKEKMDYKYEFWSEIIASKIGLFLKYKMLVYDIAIHKDEMGCLSKLMINTDKEELNEGINYLRRYNQNYNPEDKSQYDKYTFSFIGEALKSHEMDFAIEDIIRVIIFDSIIGNSDRHQENWGFITSNSPIQENKPTRIFGKKPISIRKEEFSPIYDSGSCLGRELTDEKVLQMLNNQDMLEAYVKRGVSEIRWNDGKRINHFQLISNLKNEYSDFITKEIQRLKKIYDEQNIEKIVLDIDNNLPKELKQYKIPDDRKKLIIKMVNLRFDKLSNLE